MRFLNIILITISLLNVDLRAMEQQMPPAQVSIVKAEERLLAPTLQVSATVVSVHSSEISSQVAGELKWLSPVGISIGEGQTIAEVDSKRYKLAVQTASSEVKRLKADLNFREQEVKRLAQLATRNNTSKARLQEETAKRNMLIQDIAAAKTRLEITEYDLQLTSIRAPFSGHITQQYSSKGEYISAGDRLLRLVDTTNKEVSLFAPIDSLAYVKENDTVRVTSKQHSQSLSIKAVVPVGDEVSRMVEIRLAAQDTPWVVGSPVTVAVPKSDAIRRVAFPRDALIIKGSDVYVFRVGNDMKAERIAAEIDLIDGNWVAIKADINVDDKLIIRGGERLMPGQSVSLLKSN